LAGGEGLQKKIVACVLVTGLVLASLATPPALAQGPSADGNVDVSAGDGVTRSIHFKAKIHKDAAEGGMTFSAPSAPPQGDPDNPEASASSSTGLSMDVEFDCLKVDGNRAVMGGVIVDSSLRSSIGQRILLTVEDNGEGSKALPDRLTWGVYSDQRKSWIPSDAEREDDRGASLTWIATDAERPDDVGVPSNPSPVVRCDSFPLASYSFVDIAHGDGNIQVKP
jgi:hypothetical protein